MPLFDFKCEKCNKITELLIPVKDTDLPQNCEKCKGEMLKLVPSSISICQHGYSYNTSERDTKKSYS